MNVESVEKLTVLDKKYQVYLDFENEYLSKYIDNENVKLKDLF